MSRCQTEKRKQYQDIGVRFIQILEEYLGMTLSDASRKLGYKNPTTLSAVKRGKSLPDPRRFFLISQFKNQEGRKVDLHWIFTGKREPFLEKETEAADVEALSRACKKLSPRRQKALVTLLEKGS